jgi:hypothetical protein
MFSAGFTFFGGAGAAPAGRGACSIRVRVRVRVMVRRKEAVYEVARGYKRQERGGEQRGRGEREKTEGAAAAGG